MKKKILNEEDKASAAQRAREDQDSNVTYEEREDLRKSASETPGDEDEEDVEEASLDETDEDGELLNESSLENDRFGEDLDLPEEEGEDDEQ